ncbi:MAG: extracellular solute-binding protein [Lachnospiraceae bacterium]|nr:extracellular solute-binding protein [Lachnospiraceae bacterium]
MFLKMGAVKRSVFCNLTKGGLLMFCLTLCLFSVGCGKNRFDGKGASSKVVKGGVFNFEDLELETEGSVVSGSLSSSEDLIAVSASVPLDDEYMMAPNDNLYLFDAKTHEIKAQTQTEGRTQTTQIVDDKVYSVEAIDSAEETIYKIYTYDKELNLENSVELDKKFKKEKLNNKNAGISGFLFNSKGELFFTFDNVVVRTDANLEKADLLMVEDVDYLNNFVLDNTGSPVASYCVSVDDNLVNKYCFFDFDKMKLSEPYDLHDGMEGLLNGIGEYVFLEYDYQTIFGVTKDGKQKVFLDYINSNFNKVGDINFCFYDEKNAICYQFENETDRFYTLTKGDDDADAKKTKLTFATMNEDPVIKEAIVDFNRKSKDYKVLYIDLSTAGGPDDTSEMVLNDMVASGDCPDIINFKGYSMDTFLNKDGLIDLEPYIEKDKDLGKDVFIDSVYEGFKTRGKIHTIGYSFSFDTNVASKDKVGDGIIDYDKFFDVIDNLDEDEKILMADCKDSVLSTFVTSRIGEFIDTKKGECYFDSDNFKRLLEVCNSRPMELNEDEMMEIDSVDLIKNDKLLYMNFSGYLENIQAINAIFKNNANYTALPSEKGKGVSLYYNDNIGIYSKCKDKDGAWSFIKEILTEEFQGKNCVYDQLPVRKDVMEEFVKGYMTEEEYTDKYGNKHKPVQGEFSTGNISIPLRPVTQEEVDQFMDLIDTGERYIVVDPKISDIISEEVKKYFNGYKDVDETCIVIQNRVSIYVNENM